MAECSTETDSHSSTAPALWTPPTAAAPLDAHVRPPGSKSLTNRAYVLAALSAERTRVIQPLDSRDTTLMLAALAALGAGYEHDGADVLVDPLGTTSGRARVDLGNAGTVARFTPALAALGTHNVLFDGDTAIRRRPMSPLLGALADVGVVIDHGGHAAPPFTIHGTSGITGGTVRLDSSASSQFLSALLLAAPRCREGITVRLVGDTPPSEPNVAMTLRTLRAFGADPVRDGTEFRVPAAALGVPEFTIEPDLSTAAPFVAAPLVAGGTVRITGWPRDTTQPGDNLRSILPRLGARVELDERGLVVTGTGTVRAAELDLHECSELAPVLAALLCFADGRSRLSGIAHMRGHETDRLAALATELSSLGPGVTETTDGLVIDPEPMRSGVFHTYDDHRLVMAGAVLAMAGTGIRVANPATVGKTFPGFTDEWHEVLGD